MIKTKYIWLFVIMLLVAACNSESAGDCFQNAGDLERAEVVVADFTKITVFENVGLVFKAGL